MPLMAVIQAMMLMMMAASTTATAAAATPMNITNHFIFLPINQYAVHTNDAKRMQFSALQIVISF